MNHDHVMVTGAAGFIGSARCEALLAEGRRVTGIDNFSQNYAESAMRTNLASMMESKQFTSVVCDVGSEEFRSVMLSIRPDVVVHLAATPGVRPSMEHVLDYVDNNVRATANVLASTMTACIGNRS
jgi:UDP-glucuronate 4-epimerase